MAANDDTRVVPAEEPVPDAAPEASLSVPVPPQPAGSFEGPTGGADAPPAAASASGEPGGEEATGADGESASPVEKIPDAYQERPELYVGGAFVGGFVLAKLLGRLGGG